MLTVYGQQGAKSVTPGDHSALSGSFTWVDCFQPTREEELLLETTLGVEIPTRQEMLEIETSNRLYDEGAVMYMTSTLVSRSDTTSPEAGAVTFIVTPHHIVTLRYNEYMSFRTFIADFQKNSLIYTTPDKVLGGLIDRITERLADILEKVGFEIETLSSDIFKYEMAVKSGVKEKKRKPLNLRDVLRRVGLAANLDSKTRESIISLKRLLTFLNDARTSNFSKDTRLQLKTSEQDLTSLADYSYFLADKTTFILDATLGLINIDQNDIIRIFSIASVMFMPPTLIASMYGMNFQHMPELHWEHGYVYAIFVMLLSAVGPFLFFKKKGWL